ncbi:hypothetical protein IIE18_02945 [Pseudomonas sp. V1]|uniref:hypothetical protein n=1 Tax=Pseudomonas arcuscaelestis TaxID=2710591 RepID=UPI00193F06E2|nr:hypothetical protein [Pseudomonas arcuscaelestis]MBM3104073.1 hypothetical protein [Pseudomonas arcuscaelestis]
MNTLVNALLVASIALGSSAVMAKGGNPYNNGNYDLKKINTTPLFVWRNGKLVKNPQYAIERSTTLKQRQDAARASDDSKQTEQIN